MIDYKKITIDSYDLTADQYFQKVSNFSLLPELLEFIELVMPKGNILDLGCGPGQHSKAFVQNGFEVTGIDLSEKMIDIAKANVPTARFQVMDMLEMNFSENEFDGIWASASLIHLPKTTIESVLKEIKKYLKKNGILYISVKEGVGEEMIIDDRYGGVQKYYVYFRKEEIEKILRQVGFDILKDSVREKRETYDTNPWLHFFCKKSKIYYY